MPMHMISQSNKFIRRHFAQNLSAHFGQLAIIFFWVSGNISMVRFSNYSAWLANPTSVKPSTQVVWPVVGQEILNADVGGNFQGVQVTSGFFQI